MTITGYQGPKSAEAASSAILTRCTYSTRQPGNSRLQEVGRYIQLSTSSLVLLYFVICCIGASSPAMFPEVSTVRNDDKSTELLATLSYWLPPAIEFMVRSLIGQWGY